MSFSSKPRKADFCIDASLDEVSCIFALLSESLARILAPANCIVGTDSSLYVTGRVTLILPEILYVLLKLGRLA